MISWIEQRPDFSRNNLQELFHKIPFNLACAIMLDKSHEPFVIISQNVRDDITNHLKEQQIEMGGLLIGSVYEINRSILKFVVLLESFARGKEFNSTSVSLRLDSSVWNHARENSTDTQYVVGWYHSHPNLGAFFSGTDRRTQAAFFREPHSIGLVVDPIRGQEKWYLGPESVELHPNRIIQTSRCY